MNNMLLIKKKISDDYWELQNEQMFFIITGLDLIDKNRAKNIFSQKLFL